MKDGELSRRMFLGAGGAFALLNGGCAFRAPAGLFGGGAAKFRFGVISDVHIREPGDERHLLGALRFFRERGADGVMVAGDIADQGRISQLKIFADAWYSVFPDDRGLGGQKVEKLFIYGNHDIWGATNDPELAKRRDGIGYDDARPARVWEELFHEPYSDFWIKNVKGYSFIGGHWTKKDNFNGLDAFLGAHEKELDPSKPFFYTQHAHPKDTCYGAWAWGHDNGESTRALSRFPNAVAFSGHSHYSITDERSIWQGKFTSIGTSSLRYIFSQYWRDNGEDHNGIVKQMRILPERSGRQGMLVKVYDDRMVIERREFVRGESLGADWVVPLDGTRPFAFEPRSAKAVAPAFAPGAKVEVSRARGKDRRGRETDQVTVRFPAAMPSATSRVHDYEVTALAYHEDVDYPVATKRVLSESYFLPPTREAKSGYIVFAASELKGVGAVRFAVRPLECFGHKGPEIYSDMFAL